MREVSGVYVPTVEETQTAITQQLELTRMVATLEKTRELDELDRWITQLRAEVYVELGSY
jgi:hypothetical protein